MSEESKQEQDTVAIPSEILAFLLGEGDLDGVSFGDRPAHARGNFWWRNNLRTAMNATPAVAVNAEAVPMAWLDPERGLSWLVDRMTVAPGTKFYAAPPAESAQPAECERCGLEPEKHTEMHWCDNQSFRQPTEATADSAQPAQQSEHVAVVGSVFTLYWAGLGPIAPLIERHGIKVGSKLYAAPQAAQAAPVESIRDFREWLQRDYAIVSMFSDRDMKAAWHAGKRSGIVHAAKPDAMVRRLYLPDEMPEALANSVEYLHGEFSRRNYEAMQRALAASQQGGNHGE